MALFGIGRLAFVNPYKEHPVVLTDGLIKIAPKAAIFFGSTCVRVWLLEMPSVNSFQLLDIR